MEKKEPMRALALDLLEAIEHEELTTTRAGLLELIRSRLVSAANAELRDIRTWIETAPSMASDRVAHRISERLRKRIVELSGVEPIPRSSDRSWVAPDAVALYVMPMAELGFVGATDSCAMRVVIRSVEATHAVVVDAAGLEWRVELERLHNPEMLGERVPPTFAAGTIPSRVEVGMVFFAAGRHMPVYEIRGGWARISTSGKWTPTEWLLRWPLVSDWPSAVPSGSQVVERVDSPAPHTEPKG